MTWLSRAWNGMKTPCFVAGFSVIRSNEPPDTIFATSHPNDDFILHDKRRQRHGIPNSRVRDQRLPNGPSRDRIDRNQLRIDGRHKKRLTKNRQTAINATTAGSRLK